jgi:membrane-associated protein
VIDSIVHAVEDLASTPWVYPALFGVATGFPRPSFTRFALIAAITWGVYSAGLGYLGGVAFEREPLKGIALGLGLALAITAAHEAVRLYRGRR